MYAVCDVCLCGVSPISILDCIVLIPETDQEQEKQVCLPPFPCHHQIKLEFIVSQAEEERQRQSVLLIQYECGEAKKTGILF